ncbi:adenosylcobinamide-GDP ribazoletransferase [Acinetobacter sp. ANC 4641]|uniref:adenosylcobinamide-GDP ribazoletransferase n=1 Tax=Acinetobacter sp. ANC 4641 TaxID=2529847 RepID=UPI00103C3371|nr:adenosylcobinamide-GDP ribazoletransferase [Acinetobacter sp. ANC 4641]TCB09530.1 adenosylcobinamide-GDP ribazoletransferase [Acinetobacter sp. ANC 4641]
MMPFWIALQFLTIFPIQLKQLPSPRQNAYSLAFYPVIGLLLGGLIFGLAWGLNYIHLPVLLSASLILTVWVIITGGLHLDGLADTADAWVGGYGDRERTLTIMKDPQCGPIGVLSLVLSLLLKFSSIYVILQTQHLYGLVMIPALGRLTALFLFLTCDYVRAHGLGSSFLQDLPRKFLWFILLICLFACSSFGWVGLVVTTVFCSCLGYLRHVFVRRLGGITGDTVGASIEISECVSLLSLAILLSIRLF